MKGKLIRDLKKGKVQYQQIHYLKKFREFAGGVDFSEKEIEKIRKKYGDSAVQNPEMYLNNLSGFFYEEVQKKHSLFETYAMSLAILNLGGSIDTLFQTYVPNRRNIRVIATLIEETANQEKVWIALREYSK